MKTNWIKIGETTRTGEMFRRGCYSKYVVMERILDNGMRQYKNVFVASCDAGIESIKPLPEVTPS